MPPRPTGTSPEHLSGPAMADFFPRRTAFLPTLPGQTRCTSQIAGRRVLGSPLASLGEEKQGVGGRNPTQVLQGVKDQGDTAFAADGDGSGRVQVRVDFELCPTFWGAGAC